MSGVDVGRDPSDGEGECPFCDRIRRSGGERRRDASVPADLGGWLEWGLAFRQMVTDLGAGPTHVFIVGQPGRTDRYVQGLVGHGSARPQASSNRYLHGTSRLTAEQAAQLADVGWDAPDPTDEGDGHEPANWTYGVITDDWGWLTGLVVYTVLAVFAFAEDEPIVIDTFLADHPCRWCSAWWLDDDPAEA